MRIFSERSTALTMPLAFVANGFVLPGLLDFQEPAARQDLEALALVLDLWLRSSWTLHDHAGEVVTCTALFVVLTPDRRVHRRRRCRSAVLVVDVHVRLRRLRATRDGAVEVWIRPCASVAGPLTRWTPPSYLRLIAVSPRSGQRLP